MNGMFDNLPAIQLNRDILRTALKTLDNEQVGQIIRSLEESLEGKEELSLSETESIFFEMLLNYASKKARAWLKQTSNFRNNNPRKEEKN